MENTLSINDLYKQYSAGFLEKKQFEGAVFKAIQGNVRNYGLPGLCRGDYDDYVSWLYPRISQAICAYRETGSSFEVYIGTMLRMTAREYRMQQARHYVTESAAWMTQMPDMYARESEPQYGESITVMDKPLPPAGFKTAESALKKTNTGKLKNRRQHLILVLKCSNYVSNDFLERVASRLEIEPEVLLNMVIQLRELRGKRETEINLLRERTNCQYFRCLCYEHSLRFLPDNSAAAQRLKKQLERGRARLESMRKRMANLRPDPSNQQIARVLGIARGTVDSALHHIKKSYQRNAE
ncbi:MAG: hypothetical protein FWG89_06920 [Treponema sp.]|nr:hypothetical protein [Treponema sp.]